MTVQINASKQLNSLLYQVAHTKWNIHSLRRSRNRTLSETIILNYAAKGSRAQQCV